MGTMVSRTFTVACFLENDDCRNDHQKDACVKGRMESVLKRRSDRVTDNLTDAAPADQAGAGKQYRKQHVSFFPSQPFLHQMMDIIGRSSAVSAIERILFFVQLGKSRFNKCCGRTDDGGDPHPENGSGAAGRNSSHDTYQISHPHPGGGGYDERLEGGEAVFAAFRSFQCPEHIRKEPDRKKKRVLMVKKMPVGIKSRIRREIPMLLPPGSGIWMRSPQRKL